MKEFIKSLTDEERKALGRNFVSSLADEDDVEIATRQAIAKLLLDSLPSYESDGFFEYIYQTAKQVLGGQYDSLQEIKEEFAAIIKNEKEE